MADDATAPRFLTVAEVAEMARVSRMTVYRMVHSGELPAIRVGKSYRVPQAAVEKMLSDELDFGEGQSAVGR
ncbi:MAG TPA: helix-turn-helix domain-containing protein [Candidatus Ruania gallistercoris]|uniref:Helix-turn-helix domain-containing protein n=1 Tax=Candidatus Ruania gallistercoris TaxID=2838746 RepID=A0A9D2J605_9MICO|nr:helix-turn-helix domain-containing protein [Candidatus Ruania gallistercoris]